MEPGWFGIGFPRDAGELEALLGAELKAAMDDPATTSSGGAHLSTPRS